MYEKIKKWYEQGLWSDDMIQDAVNKGIVTNEEYKEITNKETL